MKPLSLALIRQRYAEDGGAERFVGRLLQALSAERMAVTLMTRAWTPAQGFEVFTVNPFFLGRVWRDWSFARAVCRALDTRPFDLVQSHERIPCCDIYRAGDGVHREWLVQRARTLGPLGRLGQCISPYHIYMCRAERRLFNSPRLKAVICNSEMVKAEIKHHFDVPDEKLHVIYSGVDTTLYHPDLRRHRAEVRDRFGIPDSAMLFLFVGSGFERKGVAALLDAMAQLPLDVYLLVVGHDRRLAKYRRRARRLGLAERVLFVDRQRDVKPFYGAADALVLPTLYDPFPNVVLEAMASGLPVVTSTKSGAAELVEDGVDGFVCDAQDRPGLARAMRALQVHDARRALGAAARRRVEPLSLGEMAAGLRRLYAAVTPRPARSSMLISTE